MRLTQELLTRLRARGVETFHHPGVADFPDDAEFEPPCGIKWIGSPYGFGMGAFSYAVSGYFARVRIGRYCSIGEQVQIGRSSHPMTWVSSSPFFYTNAELFQIGSGFDGSEKYREYKAPSRGPIGTPPADILIGNDVWIGHGAFVLPGVKIGDGAVVGAMAVVTKDVPPYAIVAGNPATVKRMRLPISVAAKLMELAWWRFAPWQLESVDFSSPRTAIDQLRRAIDHHQPYSPERFQLKDLLSIS